MSLNRICAWAHAYAAVIANKAIEEIAITAPLAVAGCLCLRAVYLTKGAYEDCAHLRFKEGAVKIVQISGCVLGGGILLMLPFAYRNVHSPSYVEGKCCSWYVEHLSKIYTQECAQRFCTQPLPKVGCSAITLRDMGTAGFNNMTHMKRYCS